MADRYKLRVPALEIRQSKGRKLYAFAVDGKQVPLFAAISRLGRDDDSSITGYQRPEVVGQVLLGDGDRGASFGHGDLVAEPVGLRRRGGRRLVEEPSDRLLCARSLLLTEVGSRHVSAQLDSGNAAVPFDVDAHEPIVPFRP